MIVHIYNRGVDKRKIFMNDGDYSKFMEYLYLCNSEDNVRYDNLYRKEEYKNNFYAYEIKNTLVDIGAWCLMPNHFHILISYDKPENLSKFMQKISTAYSMYFNKKYIRTGALFAGTYKQKFVQEEKYYEILWSYIHLNPLELYPGNSGEVLEKYKYSSLMDFIDTNKRVKGEGKILNLNNFPNVKFKNWKEMKEISRQLEIEEG